ncbi:hypothetical protein TNCV_3412181 [Trichonephila clavipes]|nr:hypothetical protein TNCV_3412181 [Trichonephila clavipes]
MENTHRRPSGKRPKKRRFRGESIHEEKFGLKINKCLVLIWLNDNRRIFLRHDRGVYSHLLQARRAKKIKK